MRLPIEIKILINDLSLCRVSARPAPFFQLCQPSWIYFLTIILNLCTGFSLSVNCSLFSFFFSRWYRRERNSKREITSRLVMDLEWSFKLARICIVYSVHRVILFSNDSTNLSTCKREKETIVKRSFIDVSHYAVVTLFENSAAIPSVFFRNFILILFYVMYYAPFKILSDSTYLCIRIPTSLVSSFIVLFTRFISGSRRLRKN